MNTLLENKAIKFCESNKYRLSLPRLEVLKIISASQKPIKAYEILEKLGEKIPPQLDVYRDVNLGRTIVEVKAPDQVGLLHLLAKTISLCGFDIEFARIATEQGIATDIFHITSIVKEDKPDPSRFLELREKISEALTDAKFFHEV